MLPVHLRSQQIEHMIPLSHLVRVRPRSCPLPISSRGFLGRAMSPGLTILALPSILRPRHSLRVDDKLRTCPPKLTYHFPRLFYHVRVYTNERPSRHKRSFSNRFRMPRGVCINILHPPRRWRSGHFSTPMSTRGENMK